MSGRVARGISVTSLAEMVNFLINLGSTAILARILTPEDYGLIAMVFVIVTFISTFKDMGLSMATVQRKDITHEQVSTLFWINLGIGFLLGGLIALSAPLISMFYDEPRLTEIVLIFSVLPIVGGMLLQQSALLKRRMRFKAMAIGRTAGTAGAFSIAIILAYMGAGYWALVVFQVTRVVIDCAIEWFLTGWIPGLPSKAEGIKSMLAFGVGFSGFNFTEHVVRKADNVLVGWKLGAAQLGFYSKAYELMIRPINMLFVSLNPVMFSSLSRLADEPEKFSSTYKTVLEMVCLVMMPSILFLLVDADLVIGILLGDQWDRAATLFAILGFEGLALPIAVSCRWLYVSQGKSGALFRWGVINSAITLLAVIIGINFGVEGVALGVAGSGVLVRSPLLFWLVTREGPIKMKDLYGATFLPLLSGGLGALAVYFFRGLVELTPLLELAASGGVMLGVSLLVLMLFPAGRRNLKQLRRLKAVLTGRGAAG